MQVLQALWSVLKGIWFALDGLRKVLHLVLLLVLFGLLLAASQSELPYVPDRAASCSRSKASSSRSSRATRSNGRCRAPAARLRRDACATSWT